MRLRNARPPRWGRPRGRKPVRCRDGGVPRGSRPWWTFRPRWDRGWRTPRRARPKRTRHRRPEGRRRTWRDPQPRSPWSRSRRYPSGRRPVLRGAHRFVRMRGMSDYGSGDASPRRLVPGRVQPLLEAVDEPMAQRFASLLAAAADTDGDPSELASPFPLGPRPDMGAIATARTAAALAGLVAADPHIGWRHPPEEHVPPGWAHSAAAAELLGPDGSITGPDSERFGLFFLNPGVTYPDHWHDADEFYSCSPVQRRGPSAMRPPAPRPARTSGRRHRQFTASSPTMSPCSRCGAGRAIPASIPTATDRPHREATTRTHPRAGCAGDASG